MNWRTGLTTNPSSHSSRSTRLPRSCTAKSIPAKHFFASSERDLKGFPADRVHHVGHHLAHAASAYFTSGFDECLVVVIDGMGEVVSATVYRASAGRLEKLHEISAAHSIGILYSLVTLHLGFNFGADEYKIMGLAPYGDPERFHAVLRTGD